MDFLLNERENYYYNILYALYICLAFAGIKYNIYEIVKHATAFCHL